MRVDADQQEQIRNVVDKIAPNGRAMILAYDQGFEHGPRDFLANPASRTLPYILDVAKQGGFTGLVLHAGLAEKYQNEIKEAGIPLILKLNGKSELYTQNDPYAPQLYSVEDAIALGAGAVGYTVYTGSRYEGRMNQEFTKIAREAHRLGLPVIGWMYPRGRSLKMGTSETSKMALKEVEENPCLAIDETLSIAAYAARIGLELGADIVKVKYTGSPETFRQVVQCSAPTLLVMSGGVKTATDNDFICMVTDVIKAGAAGIAVGRNIWQRENPLEISKKVHKVIFGE